MRLSEFLAIITVITVFCLVVIMYEKLYVINNNSVKYVYLRFSTDLLA